MLVLHAESGLLRYDGNDVIAYRENPADPKPCHPMLYKGLKVDSSWYFMVRGRALAD